MIGILFRLLWRALVLSLAVAIAYGIVFALFPYLRNQMPTALVVIILYVLVAYFTIPLLVRLWRVAIKPNHLPLYATTRDGWASDPVNIAIVCRSRRQLIQDMRRAGWEVADRVTPTTMLKMAYAVVLNKPYPTAPFSSLYLFDRKQDIGFQIQTGQPATPRHRHHVRFWQLPEALAEDDVSHGFWHALLQRFVYKRRQIWIGAATHDIAPFALRMRNLQITHQIDSNTAQERDFLIDTLKKADVLKRTEIISSGHKLKFRGQTFGVNIVLDGSLTVVQLKSNSLKK
jgi:hypothetical protein